MLNNNNHITKTFQKAQKMRVELHRLNISQWFHETFLTWEWWFLVCLTIVPLVIWWKVLDKSRAYEIAFYGCMINIMAVILDDIGTNFSWWSYPIKLVPIVPPLLTADSILVPIIFMIVYQLFSLSLRTFFISNLITACILAFAAEPMFVWIGYYKLYDWKFIYSFLFYIVSTSVARLIIVKIVK
jgi:hypothetical protein